MDQFANTSSSRITIEVIITCLFLVALLRSHVNVGIVVEFVRRVPHDQQEYVNDVVGLIVYGITLDAMKRIVIGVNFEEETPD